MAEAFRFPPQAGRTLLQNSEFLGGEKALGVKAGPGSRPPVGPAEVRKQSADSLKGKGVSPGPGSCGLTVWQAVGSLDLECHAEDLGSGGVGCPGVVLLGCRVLPGSDNGRK